MFRPFISTAVALFILTIFFSNVNYGDWFSLLMATLVLTILNYFVKPILHLLTLPINVITFGLFSAFLNVALLWLATYLVPGFTIEPMIFFGIHLGQFMTLVVIAFAISFFQSVLSIFI